MRMYTHYKCLVQPAPGHARLLTGNYALQFVKKYRTNYVFFTIFIIHAFLSKSQYSIIKVYYALFGNKQITVECWISFQIES